MGGTGPGKYAAAWGVDVDPYGNVRYVPLAPLELIMERDARQEREQEQEQRMATTLAMRQGYEIAQSMVALWGKPENPDINAVWVLASNFSKMFGYRELDSGTEFIKGFVAGITGSKAPKELRSGLQDELDS